ncbi:MAG: TonB-dependent receptor [Flavobacteriaceae bacterium]|nr:TonB-dependent receptor [Flavobacteriaceae bacterium]
MLNKRLIIPFLCFICCISNGFAQEDEEKIGTEVVNVVKPYTPTISDAFKVKETPVLNDSVSNEKKKVNYSIFSVPVASTFTPAKGNATKIEKTKPLKLYDNYASLGFGNYTSILAELYSNLQISRTDNFGIFLKHHSSQGGIKDVRLEDKFYDTQLDANYSSRQKDISYRFNAGIEHQLFNWYGLNGLSELATDETLDALDVKQTYFSGYVGGSISIEDSFFEKANVNLRYLSDSFSSSEINFTARPEFVFPLEEITLKIDADLDYLTGSFDRNYTNTSDIAYSFLNFGVLPSLVYVNEDLTLSLGVAGYVSMDSENSETEISLHPRINASYRLVDELLIVYGGADGGLQQNTYYNFSQVNPYISPTQYIAPTSELYKAFGGLKGKLTNSVGYNVRASYGKDENKSLFKLNSYNGINPNLEGYEQGNSFGVVYDDITTLSVFGELKVEVNDTFTLGASASFSSYDTTSQSEAWNLPELEASIFSTFNITEKVYGGASLFFVGERKDQFINGLISETITLDGYIDANLHVGYRFNERLSFFAKGSNLLSDNYNKWANYPVLGIQGLLGATYKFDW